MASPKRDMGVILNGCYIFYMFKNIGILGFCGLLFFHGA